MRNGKLQHKPNGAAASPRPNSRADSRAESPVEARPASEPNGDRLPVLKTYKIFIGGKFPRTESGRYYLLNDPRTGRPLANICQCSRKDFRDAVVSARAAQSAWAGRAPYNRSQILYRIAEMLEGRTAQFIEEIVQQGGSPAQAKAEVAAGIDRLVYYAGWADKYQQIFSSVNPVASSHFNFSMVEPTGVAAILCPQNSALIGLISTIAPAICGGNTVVALAARDLPLCAVTLGEVLATSDLPGGVVNILTGGRAELLEQFASHMDVNAVIYCGGDPTEAAAVRAKASLNVKRAIIYDRPDWLASDAQGPYFILDTQEVKTTWHPIGV
ncbi:MAG: aldehyde dehydrogenase family protein [Tepidisphaeraceae bacterium]|jgi:acyl-CoA reductase-like NAD-dependent aldehyde dehydrogenase